jgi:membrane protein DedA with SNARE-associated domain
MFDQIEIALLALSEHLPLELFVLIGSFVEELLAPIPSPGILLLAGSLAAMRDYGMAEVLFLIFCGSVGKTIGALCVYLIADTAENFFTGTLARFFPLSHDEIERFGKRFTGTWRDYVMLTTLRALPFVPSVLISAGSGLLKIPMRLFLVSTFFGTLVRDSIFLYIGYRGITLVNDYLHGLTSLEAFLEVVAALCIVLGLGYVYIQRRHKE